MGGERGGDSSGVKVTRETERGLTFSSRLPTLGKLNISLHFTTPTLRKNILNIYKIFMILKDQLAGICVDKKVPDS